VVTGTVTVMTPPLCLGHCKRCHGGQR